MSDEHNCNACSAGCESRRTAESTAQEVSAGPYLIIAALAIVLLSLGFRWLF